MNPSKKLPNEYFDYQNYLTYLCGPKNGEYYNAIHIPYHTTWAHEAIEKEITHPKFNHALHINEILTLIC
jgi:putative hydrolase of the HAD superfamily